MSIPKKFHKIWIGPKQDFLGYSDTWIEKFPDYELCEWNNKNIKPYLDQMIDLLGEVPKCSFNFVSDIVRLLILKEQGGIYLDHDVEIFKNFEHLLVGSETFLTFQYPVCDNPPCFKRGVKMEHILAQRLNLSGLYDGEHSGGIFINRDDYINACTIASQPNSQMINQAIDLYVENYRSRPNKKYAMSDWGFGPQVLSHAASLNGIVLNGRTQSNSSVTVFERSLFHPLHGTERLSDNEKYQKDFEACKLSAVAFHHHAFTNLGDYMNSIGRPFFKKYAQAFTLWYNQEFVNDSIEFSKSLDVKV